MEDRIAKLHPPFCKGVLRQESWRRGLGSRAQLPRGALTKGPVLRVSPGSCGDPAGTLRLPGVCEMTVRVVAICLSCSNPENVPVLTFH